MRIYPYICVECGSRLGHGAPGSTFRCPSCGGVVEDDEAREQLWTAQQSAGKAEDDALDAWYAARDAARAADETHDHELTPPRPFGASAPPPGSPSHPTPQRGTSSRPSERSADCGRRRP
jgi:predicted RNA-binding Zn-ribbon protein involved in translation (DUF1610 family)